MLRVIFDTNIYGHLLKEKDAAKLERKIIEDKEFVVYGYRPIRKEIRDIPKETKLSKKTRVLLLNLNYVFITVDTYNLLSSKKYP